MKGIVTPAVGTDLVGTITEAPASDVYPGKPKEWRPGYWAKCQNHGTEFGDKAGCSGWKRADLPQCAKCLVALKAEAGYVPTAHKPAVARKNGKSLQERFGTAAKAFNTSFPDVERIAEFDSDAAFALLEMIELRKMYVSAYTRDLEDAIGVLWKIVNMGDPIRLAERLAKLEGLQADPEDERMVETLGKALDPKVKTDYRINAADAFLRMLHAVETRKSKEREADDALAAFAGFSFRKDGRTKLGVRWDRDEKRHPAAYELEDDAVGDLPVNDAVDTTLAAIKAGTLTSAPAGKPGNLGQAIADSQAALARTLKSPAPAKSKKGGKKGGKRRGNGHQQDEDDDN